MVNGRGCGGWAAGSSAAQARSETIRVRIAGLFLYYYFQSLDDAFRPAVPESALADHRRPFLETAPGRRRPHGAPSLPDRARSAGAGGIATAGAERRRR